jgi:hypothetical protein
VSFFYKLESATGWTAGPVVPSLAGVAQRLAFDPGAAGVYDVRALVGAEQIGQTRQVEFSAAPPPPVVLDPAGSSLVATTTGVHEVGDPHQFEAQLKGTDGLPWTVSESVSFFYKLESAVNWTAGPVVSSTGGTAQWLAFDPGVAGVYDVRALVGTDQLGQSARVEFSATPPPPVVLDPAGSSFAATTTGVHQVGDPHQFEAQLKGTDGLAWTASESVAFFYKLESATGWTAGPVVPSLAGVAQWLAFDPGAAGVYDVRALVGTDQIGQTRQVEFSVPPPPVVLDPAGSSFAATTTGVHEVGDPHQFEASLKGTDGLAWTASESVAFFYKLESATGWTAGPVVPSLAGVAQWLAFDPGAAGVYDVRALVGAEQLGQTRQVEFSAAPPPVVFDPAGSSLVATTTGVHDVGDPHQFEAVLVGTDGQPWTTSESVSFFYKL